MEMSTPLATDPYSRAMVEAFVEEDFIGVPTGFQEIFNGPNKETVFSPDKNLVEIDIERSTGKELAQLVNRGTSSSDITRSAKNVDGKYSNIPRKYPLIEEEDAINSDELLYRMAGENPYATTTRLDRNKAKALKLHLKSVKKMVRTMEFLARESVLTGQHPAILGTTNTDLIYDFLRRAGNTITVANPWNGGSADILGDVDDLCDQVDIYGNMEPNFLGIGRDAMDAFIRDLTVQTLADNRRFELIEVSTANPVPPEYARFTKNGWIARGRLRTPKGRVLWIFNYNKHYNDENGDVQYYMPVDKAIVFDVNARADRYFGPPERLPVTNDERAWYQELFGFNMGMAPMPAMTDVGGVLMPEMFYFDAYRSSDRKVVIPRSQVAPIYPTTQTDAFATAQGLIT
jgi:hypothetical protein